MGAHFREQKVVELNNRIVYNINVKRKPNAQQCV
jgi:hypothetical protein